MEMAVEAMEMMVMALGALPRPGRVPEQRLLSPEIRQWRRRSCRTLSRKTPIDLGFRSREALYRRRGGVQGWPGAPHHPLAWLGGGVCHLLVWWVPGPPPALLRLCPASGKNRRFGLCFVQFREYFLCNFSETQKQQKTGNWHCGISSIG
jgi:hypothetical protein